MSNYKIDQLNFYEGLIDNIQCIIKNAKIQKEEGSIESLKVILNQYLKLPHSLMKPAIYIGTLLFKDKSFDLDWMDYLCESIRQSLNEEFLQKTSETDEDLIEECNEFYDPTRDYINCC